MSHKLHLKFSNEINLNENYPKTKRLNLTPEEIHIVRSK